MEGWQGDGRMVEGESDRGLGLDSGVVDALFRVFGLDSSGWFSTVKETGLTCH